MKSKFTFSIFAACLGFFSIGAQTFNTVSTFAGSGNVGLIDGPVSTARFNSPYDIASDPTTGNYMWQTH
ncbi:hypothetical protein BH11BAC7_BH11BAC7_32380 [soil metagenome]